MGCFPVFKNMRKMYERSKSKNSSHNQHASTTMPHLHASRSLHSNPPISRTSMISLHLINRVTGNRTRALSAPSALDAAEKGALASNENEEQEISNVPARLVMEPHSHVPQPLPLPSPRGSSSLALRMARRPRIARSPLCSSGSALHAAEANGLETFRYEEQEWSKDQDISVSNKRSSSPLPLPLPTPEGRSPMKAASISESETAVDSVRYFRYEEIAAACRNFSIDRGTECLSSIIYRASFDHDASSKKLKATVTWLHPSTQGLREFMNEVNTLANLQHPNICKLLGFYASDCSEPRMLVYERLDNGSLDRLLFGRCGNTSIDWNTRMKIAISAAEGLAFLHEEGPLQAMYNDFSAVNIQIDMNFNAKLSGYGFVGRVAEEAFSRNSYAEANLSVETLKNGVLTPKSNVWSFGIVLLELLTGRKNFDRHRPKKERNLVRCCRPYIGDDFQFSVIMDSQLKGQFPSKAARTVAGIAQRCLQMEPSKRPTMRAIAENLKSILGMGYPSLFPLHEPADIYGRHMWKSPSVDGIIYAPRLSFSPPLAATGTSISQPPRWSGVPTVLPSPLARSSVVSNEELTRQESTQSPSSVTKEA